eukprot:347626-Chlamydomonas_euryale.AAC.1
MLIFVDSVDDGSAVSRSAAAAVASASTVAGVSVIAIAARLAATGASDVPVIASPGSHHRAVSAADSTIEARERRQYLGTKHPLAKYPRLAATPICSLALSHTGLIIPRLSHTDQRSLI